MPGNIPAINILITAGLFVFGEHFFSATSLAQDVAPVSKYLPFNATALSGDVATKRKCIENSKLECC
jgi:hypothetical protein